MPPTPAAAASDSALHRGPQVKDGFACCFERETQAGSKSTIRFQLANELDAVAMRCAVRPRLAEDAESHSVHQSRSGRLGWEPPHPHPLILPPLLTSSAREALRGAAAAKASALEAAIREAERLTKCAPPAPSQPRVAPNLVAPRLR